jgi:Homeodomain-like domain
MLTGGGGRSPFQIILRASERRWLKSLTRRGTAEHRQVTRARIVLLAAAGWTNRAIARKLGLAPNTGPNRRPSSSARAPLAPMATRPTAPSRTAARASSAATAAGGTGARRAENRPPTVRGWPKRSIARRCASSSLAPAATCSAVASRKCSSVSDRIRRTSWAEPRR